jgi:hypothetical protein
MLAIKFMDSFYDETSALAVPKKGSRGQGGRCQDDIWSSMLRTRKLKYLSSRPIQKDGGERNEAPNILVVQAVCMRLEMRGER